MRSLLRRLSACLAPVKRLGDWLTRRPRAWWARFLSRHPRLDRLWGKRLVRLLCYGGVGFVIFSVAMIHVSSQDWFCGSCHIMESYHHSWSIGAHQKVHCTACHIPPGYQNLLAAKVNGLGQAVDDILHRTSGKPSACVSDFACTRSDCHNIELVKKEEELRKEIEAKTGKTKVRGYQFNHGKHVQAGYKGIAIHCTTCHSHIKGADHFCIDTNACVVCHLSPISGQEAVAQIVQAAALPDKGRGASATQASRTSSAPVRSELGAQAKSPPRQCSQCHQAPKQAIRYNGRTIVHSDFIAYGAACESCHQHVTGVAESVGDARCFQCHDFGIEKMTTVSKLHEEHEIRNHKVQCFSCHGVMRHGIGAQVARLDQFDCRQCHVDQHVVQRDTYKRALTTAPVTGPATRAASAPAGENPELSPMFLSHVPCIGCHVQEAPFKEKPESGAVVKIASAKACDRCHKPPEGAQSFGEMTVNLWQNQTKARFKETSDMLAAVPATSDPKAIQLLNNARSLLDLVRKDGSWGVHNLGYTSDLLLQAQKNVHAAMLLAGKAAGATP